MDKVANGPDGQCGLAVALGDMGVDRTVVRAYGWIVAFALLLSAGSAAAVAWAIGDKDLAFLFFPLIAGYATVMIGVWLVMAIYWLLRGRPDRQA